MGSNWTLFDMIHSMSNKEYEFLKRVIGYSIDDLFLSSAQKDVIMGELNIHHTTYFKRIKSLEELGVITRAQKGVYKLNDNWMKLITLDVQVVGAKKHYTKTNQKLVNLKV